MIVVDLNVLIYAHNQGAPQHTRALAWAKTAFAGNEPIRIPSTVILGFLRITTRPGILSTPFTVDEATRIVEHWLRWPAVAPIEAGPNHWRILTELLHATNTRGDKIMDAHIAALAIENDATVATTDRDFARFPNVRVLNPLL